jgi:hypothetical protein
MLRSTMSGVRNHVEAVMRMMLKAVIDTEAGNEAARNGQLPKITRGLVEQLHAEAAYFLPEDGQRSCLVVFDMTDSSQIPVIVEPLFLGANARVTLVPCMNLDDVERGMSEAFSQLDAGAP